MATGGHPGSVEVIIDQTLTRTPRDVGFFFVFIIQGVRIVRLPLLTLITSKPKGIIPLSICYIIPTYLSFIICQGYNSILIFWVKNNFHLKIFGVIKMIIWIPKLHQAAIIPQLTLTILLHSINYSLQKTINMFSVKATIMNDKYVGII